MSNDDEVKNVPLTDENGHIIGRADVHPDGRIEGHIHDELLTKALRFNISRTINGSLSVSSGQARV